MSRKIIIPAALSKAAKWLAVSFAVLALVGLFLTVYIVFHDAVTNPR